MAFDYEREEYQENLRNIRHIGTYQDYENAIYAMNELKKAIVTDLSEHSIPHVDGLACLIDQVDNIYYGDIGFHTDKSLDEFEIYFVAGAICAALHEHGETDCGQHSMYYNEPMQMYMYTKVVVEADDGPDLYAGKERLFVVR